MRKYAPKLFISAAAALAVCASCLLVGCSTETGISLTCDEIDLQVGATRDIRPYVVFEPTTTVGSVTLVSDADCVSVDGTRVTATGAGVAVVTVEYLGATCELKINAVFAAPFALDIAVDGALVQTLAQDPQPIKFTAEAGGNISPTTEYVWSVDGETIEGGDTFEFAPDTVGEYTVECQVPSADLRASETVRVYLQTQASGYRVGEPDGDDRSGAVFAVRELADSRNPRSVYEWRVDGVLASNAAVFEFVPSGAGTYEISLSVNGVPREIDGENSATVTAGEFAPRGRIEFDADGTYITWNGGGAKSVSIVAPNGKRTVFERADIKYSYLFADGRFDATEYIDVCADVTGTYTIRVAADGRGEEFAFRQYPSAAREAIEKKVFLHNSFISSAADGARFADELYVTGRKYGECYLARDVSIAAVRSAVEERARALGLTAAVAVISDDGAMAAVEFTEYPTEPERAETVRSEQLHTVPHIEFDRSNLRSADNVFAPDTASAKATVATGEQLLRAVIGGYRPVPTENSVAGEIYRRAKDVLMNVIGADFDEAEKVHAIYDWLQVSTSKAGAYAGFTEYSFVESVFGGRGTNPCAVYTSAGAAKAFALLCGIEGIECAIVTQFEPNGIYYFDKVKIGGRYYYVDVYGGEATVSGISSFELPAHGRLFMSDAAAVRCGLETDGDAPDDGLAYCRAKTKYDGVYTDAYIDKKETTYEDVQVATYAVFSALDRASTVTVYCVGLTVKYPNDTLCAEFELDAAIDEELALAVIDVIAKYTAEYFDKVEGVTVSASRISVFRIGNTVIVAVPASGLKIREVS